MSAMAGKDGKIMVGEEVIGYIDNFSITVNAGTAETSAIGEAWKKFIQASRDWSGSFSGTLDYDDTAQKQIIDDLLSNTDTTYTVELKTNTNLTLTGSVIFSSVSITGSHGDKIAVSINFQGTGALSAKVAA